MDDGLRAQIKSYLFRLQELIRRGHELRGKLDADASKGAPVGSRIIGSTIAEIRSWQEECGVTINELSGGSKAHWLARSFSEAFLMRSASGLALEGASPAEIVQRLIDVLQRAVASLSDMGIGASATGTSPVSWLPASEAPPHRFDFVHNPELRPVVEQTYIDSRRALEQGDYDQALRTTCGILEAIVTDALANKGMSALAASGALAGQIGENQMGENQVGQNQVGQKKIADWSFTTRLAVAESAGLIRSGCARLPAVARTYRDDADAPGKSGQSAQVSERDARVAAQVLHVIMRDLDPGR